MTPEQLARIEHDLRDGIGDAELDLAITALVRSHTTLQRERDEAAAELLEWRKGYQPVYDDIEQAQATTRRLRAALEAVADQMPDTRELCWCGSERYAVGWRHYPHCERAQKALAGTPEGQS